MPYSYPVASYQFWGRGDWIQVKRGVQGFMGRKERKLTACGMLWERTRQNYLKREMIKCWKKQKPRISGSACEVKFALWFYPLQRNLKIPTENVSSVAFLRTLNYNPLASSPPIADPHFLNGFLSFVECCFPTSHHCIMCSEHCDFILFSRLFEFILKIHKVMPLLKTLNFTKMIFV